VEIRLPVRSAGRRLGAAEPLALAAKGTLRVLIVDDNPDAAEMLDVAVSHLGHTTRLAHDGAAAVSIATEFAPDVISSTSACRE
jgi:PleD family two-component response regulator